MHLDNKNENFKWLDSVELEMDQLDEYDNFKDLILKGRFPEGFKKIRVHLVFDLKHDGRHKPCMVADGHLNDAPLSTVHSGVVSLRCLCIITFLSELNGLETWATDIGNACLEAKTLESAYNIAGSEFGEREGHTLVISKVLYGLCSLGLRWNERFADCLKDMGLTPCKADPDL